MYKCQDKIKSNNFILQNCSNNRKQKARVAKWRKEIEQFDWSLADPYLDVEINLSSRGRKKRSLTFREFKEFAEADVTIMDLIESGYSKNILYFFSSFLKGKIKVTPKDFYNAYESGKSLEELGLYFGISRDNVTCLRQLYNIKSKGATFIKRKATEKPFSKLQKQMCIGSLLGDAKRASNASIGFGHGTSQQDYLLWKWNIMKDQCSDASLRIKSYKDNRSGSCLVDGRFYTKSNTDAEKILNLFYKDRKKFISRDALQCLDDFSLAVWFMDDGTTDWGFRHTTNNRPYAKLCTDHCNDIELDNILSFFFDRFGWRCRLCNHNVENKCKGYRIYFDVNNTEKLFNIINKHIISSMKYKVCKYSNHNF